MPLNKERLEHAFRTEYDKLNEKQKRAVDILEGPVMVIAGPGTGKTQILASRIGKILLDTDTAPENILCLTYTDAGVLAMRKRLTGLIGPDAYKVNICTFHAFCNDIIQDNLHLFEKSSLDALSELEKIQLLKDLIDTLPANHPLKRYRGDVYFEAPRLDNLFSTMKREGWTPEFIQERIDVYLTELPDREEYRYKKTAEGRYKKGDLKPDYYEEVERMKVLKAAVAEFPRYQELMRRHNRYDYNDMINWVIEAFATHPNLLSFYQEKHQYILVDEYQDTSGTQNRIVELLISYWERPNVFVVGDDDQSIFRFQGANVENMLQFAGRYSKDLLTVVLTKNYRSTQPILDVSKSLISENKERLVTQIEGLSKDLEAARESVRNLTHQPRIHKYETQRLEMIGISKQVQALVAQGVACGNIGIIYKENKYGEELATYLRQLKLPVYSKRSLNILELPLARKLILTLRYLVAEHDVPYSGDEMLFEILHFDWWQVPPMEIARLSLEVAERGSAGQRGSIRQALAERSDAPPKDLFNTGIHPGLRQASVVLESLIAALPNTTLLELTEKLIRETGVLARILRSENKHGQLQVLTGLFDFIREEARRRPLMRPEGLVGLLDLMIKENIRLPMVQVSGNDKGINLMTVHGSKGLEFEYVFVAGCNAGFWETKRGPNKEYKLPDTLFNAATSGSDLEELRRLFYVALTRAEQHLILSYTQFKDDGKEMEPSLFIAEIIDKNKLPVETQLVDTEVASEFTSLFFAAGAPEIERMEEEVIGRTLERFVMNVTALNNYLNCPLEFYFRNLIRIPAPKNEATEFGSAVHHALERLFRKMQDSGTETFPTKEEFIADFEWYMHRHRESFTREQFERRMEYGREVLPNYYLRRIAGFNKIVAIERNLRHIVVDGIPLKGKLDKLEFNGHDVNVVDYKTGDPAKAIPRTKPPTDKAPLGGDYWRQAVFYKILVDRYEQRNWNVVSSEFDFIEPDAKKEYRTIRVNIRPEDIQTVMEQVRTVWQRIQDRDFYTGCGKEKCHWCHFVKTNQLTVAIHQTDDPDAAE